MFRAQDPPRGGNYGRPDAPLPFGVIINPRGHRHDWAEEAACLVSIAQMRGGGPALVISVRNTTIYMLAATHVPRAWLRQLQHAPARRVTSELVVDAMGGWDLCCPEERARWWQALGPALLEASAWDGVDDSLESACAA